MKRITIWVWVGAVVLAVIVAGYAGGVLWSMAMHPTLRNVVALLFRWQTQTTGFLALAAGIIGVLAATQQARAVRQIEAERRADVAASLLAVLPEYLAPMAEYAVDAGRCVESRFKWQMNSTIVEHRGRLPVPTPPDRWADQITVSVRMSGPGVRHQIALLARESQVLRSRMKEIELSRDWLGTLILCGQVHARCSRIIEHSDGEGRGSIYTSKDDVLNALRQIQPQTPDRPEVIERIEADAKLAMKAGRTWPKN